MKGVGFLRVQPLFDLSATNIFAIFLHSTVKFFQLPKSWQIV